MDRSACHPGGERSQADGKEKRREPVALCRTQLVKRPILRKSLVAGHPIGNMRDQIRAIALALPLCGLYAASAPAVYQLTTIKPGSTWWVMMMRPSQPRWISPRDWSWIRAGNRYIADAANAPRAQGQLPPAPSPRPPAPATPVSAATTARPDRRSRMNQPYGSGARSRPATSTSPISAIQRVRAHRRGRHASRPWRATARRGSGGDGGPAISAAGVAGSCATWRRTRPATAIRLRVRRATRVRRVADGWQLSLLVAGTGVARMRRRRRPGRRRRNWPFPAGLAALDPAGSLYIVDTVSDSVFAKYWPALATLLPCAAQHEFRRAQHPARVPACRFQRGGQPLHPGRGNSVRLAAELRVGALTRAAGVPGQR